MPNRINEILPMLILLAVGQGQIAAAPAFAMETIYRASAFAGVAYANSIAFTGYDASGAALSYAKAAGPDWLVVDPDGHLSGTPAAADIGENIFTVEVAGARL